MGNAWSRAVALALSTLLLAGCTAAAVPLEEEPSEPNIEACRYFEGATVALLVNLKSVGVHTWDSNLESVQHASTLAEGKVRSAIEALLTSLPTGAELLADRDKQVAVNLEIQVVVDECEKEGLKIYPQLFNRP